jgi:leucyl aminopeptidase
VGKGVTFDSGGLSLKPPQAMETMKCDMGGAAATLGATLAIAALKLKVAVTTYLPLVENMPSGTAQRPGDVITAYGGKTVEVLNTDAEGRLIMMDAIVRAQEDEPDVLIDVATLTGAQMVALGTHVAGAMGNDDATRNAVVDAGAASGEMLWAMPLPEDLRPSLDSPIADIKNLGDRYGGMLTAGLFLKEFVADGQKWVHLDIAGPAFIDGGARDYSTPGGTGFGVRTLVSYAQKVAAN